MQYTGNYNLAKPDADDIINPLSREAYNDNLDTIDTKIKEASENGGVAVQPDEPTNTVLAWVDTDEEGADFCYVGDTEPTNDGSVALWVDTSVDAVKTLKNGTWYPVSSGIDHIVEEGTSGGWTYRKWSSGIAECWILTTARVEASSSTSGNIYYGDSEAISFPITFTEAPTLALATTQTASSTTAWSVAISLSTTSFILRVFRGASVTAGNYKYSAHALGRWK